MRTFVLVWLVALTAIAGCGGVEPVRTTKPVTGPTVRDRDRAVKDSAITRMLAGHEQPKRPTIPGYKLLREAEDAVDRLGRIIRLVKSRMRSAATVRDVGKLRCLTDDLEALSKLHKSSEKSVLELERALRERDRSKAEGSWLKVRVADMQAREYVHKRCEGRMHVEVHIVSPRGKTIRKSSSTGGK